MMSSDRRETSEEIEGEVVGSEFFVGTRKIGAAQFACDNLYFA
jgi:hypothetical protein